MMDIETKLFWASLDFLTSRRVELFTKHFGSLRTAKENASQGEFIKAGIPPRAWETFEKKRKELDFSRTLHDFEKSRAGVLFFLDDGFPASLNEIPDPPVFLFMRGKIEASDARSIAVVGTRDATVHGKNVVIRLLPELITAGFAIVSGLARGIDAEAHKVALDHEAKTIAFLGTGIDVVYPRQHEKLQKEIEDRGTVFSEFPLGSPPDPYHFPRRNRLISGFSLGTLVIEGEEGSGSLITAEFALEQGKEVFAVPGSPFSEKSSGPNRLIQKGMAKLVITAADIMEEFSHEGAPDKPIIRRPEDPLESSLFDIIGEGPVHFDEIVEKTGKKSGEILSSLTIMDMKGLIRDLGMNMWSRG